MANVSIQSLEKSYNSKLAPAVPSLDLEVEDGEFLTLLGPSGCGKTTTLRCVAGLERPTGGTVSIGGQVVDDPAHRIHVAPDKRDIGMVFQSYALWPHMTVAANVGYPLRMRKVAKQTARKRVLEVLAMVGLAEYADRMSSDLSGGQQQRVALARAIVAQPRLVLFDEPLSNLDARLRQDMRNELRDMHRRLGMTSLFVTHDQEEAVTLSTRIVVLRSGRIEQVGTPREIYWSPVSHFVADFVGYDGFVHGKVMHTDQHGIAVRVNDTDLRLDCPPREGFTVGQEVEVAMRSSAGVAGEEAAGMPNSATGTVVDAIYRGDELEFVLSIGGQRLSFAFRTVEVARIWPNGTPVRGDEITVAVPPSSLACLPLPTLETLAMLAVA